MNTLLNKSKVRAFLCTFCLLLIISISVFFSTLKNVSVNGDVAANIAFSNAMWEGTKTISYPGWFVVHGAVARLFHISGQNAAALSDVLFAMLCGLTIFWLCDFLGEVSLNKKCAIVLFMHFFGPLYFPQFGESYYLGQGSFNTWHSSTNSCVKFAALFVFVAFTQYFHMKKTEQWILSEKIHLTKKQLAIVLCVATFASLLLKPSFFQVFAPMLVVVFVMDFICEGRSLKEYFWDASIFLPSAALMGFQAIKSIFSPSAVAAGGGMEIAFLEVWKLYSNNILLSILSVALFPAFVGIFCEKKLRDNKLLLYAYIFHAVAILEFALLAESGIRRAHGNFMWGMNLSIGILFFASVLTFVCYLRENINKQAVAYKTRKYIGYALLVAHLAGGVWYYLQLLLVASSQCF